MGGIGGCSFVPSVSSPSLGPFCGREELMAYLHNRGLVYLHTVQVSSHQSVGLIGLVGYRDVGV